MKKFYQLLPIIIITIILSNQNISSQEIPDGPFFGQTPPGAEPEIFAPGVISLSDRKETRITFSPDGLKCFLATNIGMLYTKIENGSWTEPQIMTFSNTDNENEPMISPNGNNLYFVATQPGASDYWIKDIYVSEKNEEEWLTPVKLEGPVNSDREEWHPSITIEGTLYFCSNRSGNYFLYTSEKVGDQYLTVDKLPNIINSAEYGASDPYIASDESYLIFTSGLHTDQFISYHKENGTWTNPKNLGSHINTEGIEYGSFVSYDSNYYFFSRIDDYGPYGNGDLYWVNTSFIDSLRYTNFDPYLLNPIPDQNTVVGTEYIYEIPDTTFFDDDGNETLAVSVMLSDGNDLPDSLHFNPETNTISGKLVEAGSYSIKVTATDTAGACVSDVFKLTVNLNTNAIEKEIDTDNLLVFPNPANQTIQIKTNNSLPGIISYQLVDISGKNVKQGRPVSDIINITGINKGLYILYLRTENEIISKKIIVE